MASRVQPLLVGGVDAWLEAFTQPTVLIELGALALCAVLAWALVGLLRRGVRVNDARSILFGRNVIDGVLFPLALLALAYVARTLLQQWVPLAAF
ncbi:MAG: mechanosensitive ion channel protein, partial [Giesbergeria sp.]|nr:mechanosensitive ion channel protein [Giesbergeria sp.]